MNDGVAVAVKHSVYIANAYIFEKCRVLGLVCRLSSLKGNQNPARIFAVSGLTLSRHENVVARGTEILSHCMARNATGL